MKTGGKHSWFVVDLFRGKKKTKKQKKLLDLKNYFNMCRKENLSNFNCLIKESSPNK